MKIPQRISICIMLCSFVLLVGLIACNEEAHDGECGLTVALDNRQCPDIPIDNVKLYIYDTSRNLTAVYNYVDARGVAAALLSLEIGHYTVAVVINADEEVTETVTLTALHEWLSSEMNHDTDLLSGIAEVDVTEYGISRVTVSLRQGTFTLSTLRLLLTMPDETLPDYAAAKTRASSGIYVIRCIAELCRPGTDKVVLRKTVTPELQADGTYLMELEASDDTYDLRLWTDYVHADTQLTDTYYHTESLKAVEIVTEPYIANTDAKNAGYHNEIDIALPEEGATINVQLQRPLAKYRIIANDVEAYRELAETEPEKFPPIEELTLTVQYEGYFPSAFNVANGKPSNAITNLSFTNALPEVPDGSKEAQIASDWILTGGEDTFVNVNICIRDKNGAVRTNTTGVKIAHKRNHQTIIRGNFLTAGIGSGGVNINTEWEDTYIIEF